MIPMEGADAFFMRRALALAEKGWATTAPNPMVGAVLVRNDKIVGEGWHSRDGGPHAEIECLRDAASRGESAEGATMYVTLEPCSTKGRTGACSEAIKAAKVARVVIGALDPNPAHAGRAVGIFSSAGIACSVGVLGAECERLNFIYNYAISNAKALLALKYAVSSDGKIAAARGVRTEITAAAARADLMRWRALFSAIGVGSGTVLSDNPSLTSRGGSSEKCGLRLIFNSDLSLADYPGLPELKVFSDRFAGKSAVVCAEGLLSKECARREDRFAAMGVAVWKIGPNPFSQARSYWDELKARLYREGFTSVMIEGGARVFSSVNAARAGDFAFEYLSPKILGGGLDAFEGGANFAFENPQVRQLSADVLKYGKIAYLDGAEA